jgi:predicted metal-dependent hydrolase
MLFLTRNFIMDRTAGALELLRQDGITGPRAMAGILWYAWINPGMFRKIFAAWVKFFLPGFHPWNEDDRALIANFEISGDFVDALPGRKVRSAA